MAAQRKTDRSGGTTVTGRARSGVLGAYSSKIHVFTQHVYKKTGGATAELRRVYDAYLANQHKTRSKD
jgi:hypothetical protein